MQSEARGNFLLQALLAIALVMFFMPFVAQKLSSKKNDSELSAIARQANSAAYAAREFIKASKDNLAYGQQHFKDDDFTDLLEPFGLPLGFVTQTSANQEISLFTGKKESEILSVIVLRGGNLSELKKRELLTRIGPDAAIADADGILHGIGGWEKNLKDFKIKPDVSAVYILIPSDDDFSELVRRKAENLARAKFHTNLNMGNFSIKNVVSLTTRNAEFDVANFDTLSITGSGGDRKFKNDIGVLSTKRAVFQKGKDDNPLSIYRGDLKATALYAQTLFKYGLPGTIYANSASLNSLSMSAGHTGFYGMYDWDVHSDVILNNVSIDTEYLEVNGFINASRGQDVFIDQDELTYSSKSGVETESITTAFITLRDQISSALLSGDDSAIIMDIRPAGVSVLPDILVDTIDNDNFQILKNPDLDDGEVVTCRSIISSLSSSSIYNSKSVIQNIICQFVFWQRLERRIDIKQCLIDGNSDCG